MKQMKFTGSKIINQPLKTLIKMKQSNSSTRDKAIEFDYNKPIPANEIELLSFKDTGTKKLTCFKYAGSYYTQIYNYSKNFGFKFIEKYNSAEHQSRPLSQQGELIYSTTLESNCTQFGKYLEYSLGKNGALNDAEKKLSEHPSPVPDSRSKEEIFNNPKLCAEFFGGQHSTDESSVGFTKGEWYVEDDIFIRCGKVPVLNTGIANFLTYEENKANAQRIVTAVNNFDAMYAALKDIITELNNLEYNPISQNKFHSAKAILNTIDNK
jgi:hypothetical protein